MLLSSAHMTTEMPLLLSGVPDISPNRQQVALTARELLMGQLALAEPPITGRRVGCVLETEAGDLFSEHNHELENPPRFHHAEERTLGIVSKHAGSASLRAVYMAGADPRLTGQQLKNITPCSDCYELLEPHLAADAELVLFEPNTLDNATVFTDAEFRPAYGKWPHSSLKATKREDIIEELQEKAELTEDDREVVADLRLVGQELGVEFYLTGSASGRGWMSSVINRKLGISHGDIDIIAISNKHGKKQLKEIVGNILGNQYSGLEVTETETDYWVVCGKDRGTKRHVNYLTFLKDGRKVADLSWADNLKVGMLRDDFYTNNYYHKIS